MGPLRMKAVRSYLRPGVPREIRGIPHRLIRVGMVAFSLFEIWAVLFSSINPLLHRALFVSGILALTVLTRTFRAESRRDRVSLVDGMLAALFLVAGGYFLWNFPRIEWRWPLADPLSAWDALVAGILVIGVLEMTRRVLGPVLLVVIAVFATYVFAGQHLGGLLRHRPISPETFLDQLVYTTNGILGSPIAITVTYVYMFLLFGAVLEVSGAGELFFRLANKLTGRTRGGPAKVAVVTSALYGTISGSPTSDVATTGTFTIPLMKRLGYSPTYAGAVEAVAATGAGILPPVMGSSAFLMAELTGIPYVKIAIAAAVPGLLYYFAIFLQVHWKAVAMNLQPLASQGQEPFRLRDLHHLVPLVLLVGLMVWGFTPTLAAGVAMGTAIVLSWLDRQQAIGPRALWKVLEKAADRCIVVASATAAAGIVVGSIVITGLGGKVSGLLFQWTEGSLLLSLILCMSMCLLLGMGMPVAPAYVLTAVLAGPALVGLGLSTLQAHLFIVYFSVLSAITPPVAVAAYAAAGIAGAEPNRVGFLAVRLGLVAFIVPYFFAYQPELLLIGSVPRILWACATSVVGVTLLASGFEGHFFKPMLVWERWTFGAAGLLLIDPGLLTDLVGAILAVLAGLRQARFLFLERRGKKMPATVLKSS
ncbi:MAG: TRAP transporter fused permease subunit [Acidobacteria bacterium]|nr:TRAP transporter fused permease subunit [Acidobacteriota bacterium]